MIKKRKILIVFCFVAYASTFAQDTPNRFSLEEAMEWGMEFNRSMQQASLELQKAHKEKWQTLSVGFPQINANFNYQNFIEQPVSIVPAQFFGGNEGEFAAVTFGTQQTAYGGVELTQLLFDGTYIVGVQGIKTFIENAENILELTELEIKKTIISSYSNVLATQESLLVLKNNAELLKKNIAEVHQLYRNGFAEEENVEQLQLTLARLNAQIRFAEKTEKLAFSVFKLLLGIEQEQSITLSEDLENLTMRFLADKEPSSDYSSNINIRVAENRVAYGKLEVKYELAKGLPTISAFISGAYNGNSNEFTFTDSDQKWFGSSVFGLRMRVPIFSSLGRTAGTQKAKLGLQQAELNLDQTRAEVAVAWQEAVNNVELARENYATAKESLALAERIHQKNTTKFFEGLSSSFDLRQAQQQLYEAQQNLIQSMQNVIREKTNLNSITNNLQ